MSSKLSVNRAGSRPITRLLAALMLAAAIFVLTGCGGVEGTYVAQQGSGDEAGKLTLELKSGGACTMTMSSGGMSLPAVSGTYTVRGDFITTTLAGDKDVFTRKGDTLTASFMGEALEFKKQ